jgi:hypothetical protein
LRIERREQRGVQVERLHEQVLVIVIEQLVVHLQTLVEKAVLDARRVRGQGR